MHRLLHMLGACLLILALRVGLLKHTRKHELLALPGRPQGHRRAKNWTKLEVFVVGLLRHTRKHEVLALWVWLNLSYFQGAPNSSTGKAPQEHLSIAPRFV